MSFPFAGSPMGSEIARILANDVTLPIRVVSGTVHLLDSNINVKAVRIMNLDIIRDYENNYMDELTVSCVFPIGTYMDIIYPHKENLEFTLEATPATLTKDGEKKKNPVQRRYIAKIIEGDNPRISPDSQGTAETDEMDLVRMITVNFQLSEKAIFLLRMSQSGCIARKTTVKKFMQTWLTHELSKIDVAGDEKIIGIDLIEPDNTEEIEQIVIPQGTTTLSIPDYLQNRLHGVYKHGISSYIQNKVWYIYPRHDLERDPIGSRYITIFVIPPDSLPSVDRSYRKDGEHYKILCTGRITLENHVNPTQLNVGSGVRYSHAHVPLQEVYPQRSGNKAMFSKDVLNKKEELELPGKEKPSPYAPNHFTINPYKELSDMSATKLGVVNCLWENSLPIIIEPGTLAKIHYLDQSGQTLSLEGVVVKAHHSTYLPQKGLIQETFVTNTGLSLLVKNDVQSPEAYTKKLKGGAKGWMSGSGSNSSPAMSLASLFGGKY